ncbi:MAG: site-specific DNA-methyltransferase, partial [Bacteroidales bacterium]|nr:site-specific DNA-methyltransferase [Bacteroidales bacterium]
MSTNVSKQKRKELTEKVKAIHKYIAATKQDENTRNMLAWLSDIEKEINAKKFGLAFEEHREAIDETLETHTPVLSENKKLFIDNGGQVNFLIEGDNLAALQLLLKTHKGKIDVIYIDPPYNTGAKNWKYDNNYVDSNDLFRHSKWLSFMTKRLKIAKKLLKKNGALICAIDENEQKHLGITLEDIFGDYYTFDCITVVHNPGGIQGANFSYCHEFVYFVYPRQSNYINKEKRNDNDLTPFRDWGKENSKRIGAPNCFYPIVIDGKKIVEIGDIPDDDFHPKAANVKRKNLIYVYPIDNNGIERRWRFSRDSVNSIVDELVVVNIDNIYNIQRNKQHYIRKTVWDNSKFNANIYGTQLLSKYINGKFPFPKSLFLIMECIQACEKGKDITVLDFFAGSGTTGHAVMQLNKQDDGKRNYILCTNNENNICLDITYDRINQAIKKDNFFESLKYYKIDYIPISEKLYYEYADELLKHIRELVELENGINFLGNDKIAIVLTDEEL